MYDKLSVHPANKQVISYMVNLCAKDFIGRKYLIIKKIGLNLPSNCGERA